MDALNSILATLWRITDALSDKLGPTAIEVQELSAALERLGGIKGDGWSWLIGNLDTIVPKALDTARGHADQYPKGFLVKLARPWKFSKALGVTIDGDRFTARAILEDGDTTTEITITGQLKMSEVSRDSNGSVVTSRQYVARNLEVTRLT